jgi:Encapsulating protein for peroxidase
VKALVELRVPFELDRKSIDDVDRGANDSDWQPAKDAARQVAFAEDAVPPPALEASARAPAIPSRRFPPTFASTPMPSLKA